MRCAGSNVSRFQLGRPEDQPARPLDAKPRDVCTLNVPIWAKLEVREFGMAAVSTGACLAIDGCLLAYLGGVRRNRGLRRLTGLQIDKTGMKNAMMAAGKVEEVQMGRAFTARLIILRPWVDQRSQELRRCPKWRRVTAPLTQRPLSRPAECGTGAEILSHRRTRDAEPRASSRLDFGGRAPSPT